MGVEDDRLPIAVETSQQVLAQNEVSGWLASHKLQELMPCFEANQIYQFEDLYSLSSEDIEEIFVNQPFMLKKKLKQLLPQTAQKKSDTAAPIPNTGIPNIIINNSNDANNSNTNTNNNNVSCVDGKALAFPPMHPANLQYCKNACSGLLTALQPAMFRGDKKAAMVRNLSGVERRDHLIYLVTDMAASLDSNKMQLQWVSGLVQETKRLEHNPAMPNILQFLRDIYENIIPDGYIFFGKGGTDLHVKYYFREVDFYVWKAGVYDFSASVFADDTKDSLVEGSDWNDLREKYDKLRELHSFEILESAPETEVIDGKQKVLYLWYKIRVTRGDGHCFCIYKRYHHLYQLMAKLEEGEPTCFPLYCGQSFKMPTFLTSKRELDFPTKDFLVSSTTNSSSAKSRASRITRYLNSVFDIDDVESGEKVYDYPFMLDFIGYTPEK